MRKKAQIVALFAVLLLLSNTSTKADECDCRIYPFNPDPPCHDICSAYFLSALSVPDLVVLLGINPDLAQKIFEVSQNYAVSSLDDYREWFSEPDFTTIEGAFRGLSQDQFNALVNAIEG